MDININDLTPGQIKQLQSLLLGEHSVSEGLPLTYLKGKKVIIRTYSAGVHFGTLKEKSGDEVLLTDARRLWHWHTTGGISLSSVAVDGIDQDKSKIAEPVASIWLKAIEIIELTKEAIETIESAKNVEAS